MLTDYQDAAYAQRYRDSCGGHRRGRDRARARLFRPGHGGGANLFKLMAYKDEYEVARLYADGTFLKKLHGSSRVTSRSSTIWRRRCSRRAIR